MGVQVSKDFMKKFPKKFDPIFGLAVVKLWFHVAVAVELATARRGMGKVRTEYFTAQSDQ